MEPRSCLWAEAVLRHSYEIPEDRLQLSVTYEKHLDRDR
jgi:hypothetical protein